MTANTAGSKCEFPQQNSSVKTQEEGEQYALHAPDRLWALVTFKSGPSHEGLTDYTIRMNYTTVPRTWVPVNKWSRHLRVGHFVVHAVLLRQCQMKSGLAPSAWTTPRCPSTSGCAT